VRHPGRLRSLAPLLAVLALLAAPTAALAANDPNALVTPASMTSPPPGRHLTGDRALAIANAVPKIVKLRREHRGSYTLVFTQGSTNWVVNTFAAKTKRWIGTVTIDDTTGKVQQAWTGYQAVWAMTRGNPRAFGRSVNALYVWVPLCVLFIAPFLPWRRRPGWLHLDLLVLLAFSVSLAFFNHGRIGLSTPLIYPLMIYLLVRMLLVARRGPLAEPLRLLVPVRWLAVGLVLLTVFRVGFNVTGSNVIDVGFAGVIGAHDVATGKPIYGNFPGNNSAGDTYGPVAYYSYLPFERTIGWSGNWDALPAAHAAAIAFDLLTMLGLFLLGRRVRGPTLGIVLAYAWASYPFTLYALASNSNDSLVAMLLVGVLLVAGSAPARGALAALAGLTKFAPLALAPLFARTPSDAPRGRVALQRTGTQTLLLYAGAFAVVAAAVMIPVLYGGGGWHTFWQRTIVFQRDRRTWGDVPGTPLTIWGLWFLPGILHTLAQLGAVGLALAVGVWPRRRTLVQVAALGAAVVIALQMTTNYWFYLYIVWFFPFAIFGLLGRYGARPRPEPLDLGASRGAAISAQALRGGEQELLDPVGA
jgi:hypothetical protein